MKPIVVKELNIQIQEELYSAYLYQAIAAYAKSKSLDGFANWFDIQVKEEIDHARGFITTFLIEEGKWSYWPSPNHQKILKEWRCCLWSL